MGDGCNSLIIAEADWILLMPILYIFGCFELYKASIECLILCEKLVISGRNLLIFERLNG
jgi:hypothetical protein